MFHRSRGLLAVLPFAVLCAAAPAQAAPTSVTLRVEGKASTLYEARVTTDARPVDGGDGSGPHPCQGDPGGPAPNAGSALADAAGAATGGFAFRGSYSASFGDFLIENVAGELRLLRTRIDAQRANSHHWPTKEEEFYADLDRYDRRLLKAAAMLRIDAPTPARDQEALFSEHDRHTLEERLAGSGLDVRSPADGDLLG